MKILLVEDHRLVADAMQVMLKEIEPEIEVTACYSTQHALSVVDEGHSYGLVITDLFMPGIDGIGLIVGLRNRHNKMPIVVVSGSDDDKYIRAAIDQGASGFIPKTLPGAEMIAGLKQVINGGQCFPERFTRSNSSGLPDTDTQHAANDHSLNSSSQQVQRPGEKQMQVLQLMADGNSNKQISQIVGISEATVKYHTSQLFKLFSVKNRTSCVREAQQRGLIRSFEEN